MARLYRGGNDGSRDARYASSLAYHRSRHQGTKGSRAAYLPSILLTVVLCVVSFFAGTLWSLSVSVTQSHGTPVGTTPDQGSKCRSTNDRNPVEVSMTNELSRVAQELASGSSPTAESRFPDTMSKFASGVSRIAKDDFTTAIDLGVPIEDSSKGDQDVLIVYNRESAFPSGKRAAVGDGSSPIPVLNTSHALEQCEHLHVVLVDHGSNRKQCTAIVPQYESFHIQNWMRVPASGGAIDSSAPLRFVSRGYQSNGRQQFVPPLQKHIQQFWGMLQTYIREMPNTMKELKPLAERVSQKTNTVIVMVCNYGQSELLMNFACSARANNIDTSQVLVFATDQETKELAEGIGLTAFYDKANFGDMPADAARRYGDKKFTAMMMAKVLCVQMVSSLGYNVLFQDVDLVWFKNPLEYFENNSRNVGDFDMYFQDDGAHTQRYAPYSANTGFYYVQANDRTQYFFTALLHAGDLILKMDSHQQALIAMINEHASLFGLRVKVLGRNTDEFPGGYHYHQKSGNYMRAFFKGDVDPFIFHMSWTENKNNKLLFLKQSGMWFVQEACVARTATNITSSGVNNMPDLTSGCCSAEPLISCHYRDKPSKVPCRDSPSIDKGKPSFW